MRDFDKSGFNIVHSARTSNRRYTFQTKPNVIDLGLRLTDVASLQSEPVEYPTKKDPKVSLRRYGATEDERQFLVNRQVSHKRWAGDRVELNALTSDQFLTLIRRKFAEHGVTKVVPDADTVVSAYQRATRITTINKSIAKIIEAAHQTSVTVPDGFAERLSTFLKEQPLIPWDKAVALIAESEVNGQPMP